MVCKRILRKMEANELIKAHTVDFELGSWNLKIWGLTPTGALLPTPENEKVKFLIRACKTNHYDA